jgi:hypothetical protein
VAESVREIGRYNNFMAEKGKITFDNGVYEGEVVFRQSIMITGTA